MYIPCTYQTNTSAQLSPHTRLIASTSLFFCLFISNRELIMSLKNQRLKKQWPQVKRTLEKSQASAMQCAIATIHHDGMPHITPVGTVFLRDNQTGYFFDHYANALGENIDHNPNVCISAVNVGRWYWFKALFTGKFSAPPGIRLYGKAGPMREATADEIALIEARVKPTLWLKGARMLWTDFKYVREIEFTDYKPVTYPVMMDGMWSKE
jgi:hypothetical protein